MRVDESSDSSRERTDHLDDRTSRSTVGSPQYGLRVGVRVVWRGLVEMPGQCATVDLEVPTATGAARTRPPAIPERDMAVLAAGPGRTLHRYTVDQQRPAQTYLDDEVQRRTRSCCRSG